MVVKTGDLFPKTIYARIEKDDDENYMVTGESPEEVADQVGQTVVVGRYVLVGQGVVHNKPYYVEDGDTTSQLGDDEI